MYHHNRDIKLECDTNLITNDALQDFQSTKVRLFPNLGRELEVDDEPESAFKTHQMDTNTCTEAGNLSFL